MAVIISPQLNVKYVQSVIVMDTVFRSSSLENFEVIKQNKLD